MFLEYFFVPRQLFNIANVIKSSKEEKQDFIQESYIDKNNTFHLFG